MRLTYLSGVHELRGVDVEELLGVLQPHVRRLHQLRVGARQRDPLHAAVPGPEIMSEWSGCRSWNRKRGVASFICTGLGERKDPRLRELTPLAAGGSQAGGKIHKT